MAATSNGTAAPKPVRCAIYTRKSTEEGIRRRHIGEIEVGDAGGKSRASVADVVGGYAVQSEVVPAPVVAARYARVAAACRRARRERH
jgi:hypothetical protein